MTIGPADAPLTVSAWLRWFALQPYLAEIPDDSRFLEVGCGLGGYAARLDQRFEYVGYELDSISAAVAAGRVARGEVRSQELPRVPEAVYDAIAAFEVIEHIQDETSALRNWRRWLSPGGRILLSVPADPERFGASDRHVGHYRRYTEDGLLAVLHAAGFKDVRVKRYGAPLNNVTGAIRNRLVFDSSESFADRTAASGRWLQPSRSLGWVTWLATLPFQYIQGPLSRMGYGPGFVAIATARDP